MPDSMHDDRGARRIALPLLAGALVTAIVAAVMLASPTPWLLAADTGNGFIGQTVPAYRAWMSGRIPEWTDLLWGGYPIVGDCSNAALYPPHLLAYFATRSAPLRFFDAAFALHAGILAAGSAYLMAVLGAGRPAQCLAAALAATAPFTHYCAMIFFPVFAAQAWWPWALAAAERLARPSTPWLGGAMVLGWVALAAQVFAGMPEQATYGAIVAGAWLLTRRSALPIGARAVRLALLGVGTAALAAPQLLPTSAYVQVTERAARMDHTLSGAAALVLDEPAQLFLAGTGALHDMPSFLGLAVPILVLIGVTMRRPRAAFLAVVAVTALAYAMGAATPVYGWLHHLPPLDHFRAPLKLEALVELALVWSAALGFDAALRARAAWGRPLALGLALAACVERAAYLPGELAAFDKLVARTGVPPTLLERLAASRPVQNRRPAWPPPQVLDINGPYGGGYARSLGTLVGLASIRPYPVSLLSRAHLAVFASRPNRAALPALLGVQYMLVETRNCEKVARGSRWPVVQITDEFCMIENPRPSDRYTLVTQAKAVATEDDMLEEVRTRPEGPVPVLAPPDALATLSNGYVWAAPSEPGRAELRVVTGRAGLVLVRQSALPGWDVRVDGTPVTPYPAAGIYFAVPVRAGTHQVVLQYRTPGFRTGLAVSVGWMLLVAVAAVLRRLLVRRASVASALTAPARS
jgi:hypothetical protein